jgi:hypothetical protein
LFSCDRKLLTGLFGAPHKAESERLIVARRPQNATERRLCWGTLPPHDRHMVLYLHSFGFAPMSTFAVLGMILVIIFIYTNIKKIGITEIVLGEYSQGRSNRARGRDDCRYHMCLSVLAMGDLNSVDIAQCIHEGLLIDCGCLHDWLW